MLCAGIGILYATKWPPKTLGMSLQIEDQFVQELPFFFMIKNQEKGKELEIKNVPLNTEGREIPSNLTKEM